MVDVAALSQILSVEAGVWSLVAIAFVIAFRIWAIIPEFMAKLNERRRDRQGAADRLLDRLEARVTELEAQRTALEHLLSESREECDEWRGRAIAAEATMIGKGRADQEAQRILSAEREADAATRRGKT